MFNIFRLSITLILLAILVGCSEQSDNPHPVSLDVRPTASPSPRAIQKSEFPIPDDPKNPFNAQYTKMNSIQGTWQLYRFFSNRKDYDPFPLIDFLSQKSRTFLKVIDREENGTRYAEINFEIQPLQSTSSNSSDNTCKITLEFDGYYCCMDMLRMTFIERGTSPGEQPAGCALSYFGMDAHTISKKILQGLFQSPTSPFPGIYHFSHSLNQEKIRLQNPPPQDKTQPIIGLETELHFEKVE